jgi:hypothetical protein
MQIQPLLAGRTAGYDQPVLTEGRKVVTADFELDRRYQVGFQHATCYPARRDGSILALSSGSSTQYLTATTTIPLADITVISQPSPCTIAGAEIGSPQFATPFIITSFSGCSSPNTSATLQDGPATSNGTYDGPSGVTLTISGTPETTTTPEPSSVLLFGSGLAAFAGLIRRRVRL